MAYEARHAAEALDAVGNRTRRAVLQLLQGGEQTVGELTAELPVTQSAVSQHLKILREAQLVHVRDQGTRRLYSVNLDGLSAVRAWVDGFWDDVLTAFITHANEQPQPQDKRHAHPNPQEKT